MRCVEPHFDRSKVWVLPKVWKGPKGHQTMGDATLRWSWFLETSKQKLVIFPKNALESGEGYGSNSSLPTCFCGYFLKVKSPKIQKPWTFAKNLCFQAYLEAIKAFQPGDVCTVQGGLEREGRKVDIVYWLEGKGAISLSHQTKSWRWFCFMASTG